MLKLSTMSVSNILQKLNFRDTKLIPQFPKLNKKIKFASILIAFVFLGFLGHKILAADTAIEKFKAKQAAIDKGNNQESWMNESMMSNAMSINTAIAGTIPDSVLNGTVTSWIPGGMIGFTNNAIATLYNPPASGVQYIAETFNNFLGKPAYATNGYDGLKGIQNIWKSFRNAVYILFSIVFVGIGIAIMLRVKISQQAVISIQSAIPSLITSLILVTFSYAIAGLLIDLSYVFQGLVLAILFSSKGGLNSELFPGFLSISPTFSNLVTADFWTVLRLTYKAVPIATMSALSGIVAGAIAGLIGGFTTLITAGIGWVPGLIAGGAVGGLAFILIFAIILITIIVNVVKFFIGMAKCFINIILRIILAPLEIGMGAIPNSKMNFSSWIWNIIANLAVFPLSLIFLVLVNMIIDSVNTSNLWAPPMLGGSWLLGPLIGISALMILAKLPAMIPEFIFQLKPSPWGKAIGESFASIGKTGKIGEAITGEGLNRASDLTGEGNRSWQRALRGANTIWQRAHNRH